MPGGGGGGGGILGGGGGAELKLPLKPEYAESASLKLLLRTAQGLSIEVGVVGGKGGKFPVLGADRVELG